MMVLQDGEMDELPDLQRDASLQVVGYCSELGAVIDLRSEIGCSCAELWIWTCRLFWCRARGERKRRSLLRSCRLQQSLQLGETALSAVHIDVWEISKLKWRRRTGEEHIYGLDPPEVGEGAGDALPAAVLGVAGERRRTARPARRPRKEAVLFLERRDWGPRALEDGADPEEPRRP